MHVGVCPGCRMFIPIDIIDEGLHVVAHNDPKYWSVVQHTFNNEQCMGSGDAPLQILPNESEIGELDDLEKAKAVFELLRKGFAWHDQGLGHGHLHLDLDGEELRHLYDTLNEAEGVKNPVLPLYGPTIGM